MLVLPFVVWLAIVTSAVMLVVIWVSGESGRTHGSVALGWLLVAGYCQLFGTSAVMAAIGLILQTLLAIYLLVRWKLSA